MIYVYILECADKSFYVGSTMSIKLRLQQHNSGKGARYTSKRLPVKLVYLESVSRLDRGFEREHQIKRWSRRKKQALIDSDFKLLRELSKAGSTSSPANLTNEIPLTTNSLSIRDSSSNSPANLTNEIPLTTNSLSIGDSSSSSSTSSELNMNSKLDPSPRD